MDSDQWWNHWCSNIVTPKLNPSDSINLFLKSCFIFWLSRFSVTYTHEWKRVDCCWLFACIIYLLTAFLKYYISFLLPMCCHLCNYFKILSGGKYKTNAKSSQMRYLFVKKKWHSSKINMANVLECFLELIWGNRLSNKVVADSLD